MGEKINIALRVIAAAANYVDPADADIDFLRSEVAPEHRNCTPKELARIAIHDEFKQRAERRALRLAHAATLQ